jgi:hypothetical protein
MLARKGRPERVIASDGPDRKPCTASAALCYGYAQVFFSVVVSRRSCGTLGPARETR